MDWSVVAVVAAAILGLIALFVGCRIWPEPGDEVPCYDQPPRGEFNVL